MICKYCLGMGYIVDPMPPFDCPACKGKGEYPFFLKWIANFRWKIFYNRWLCYRGTTDW